MAAAIRTPDQRIRVFVSSTLKELEPERVAARAAIESLRLAPVMFELGARPHPPRDLYRSYLDQSDIFVGLYGERYGWVAPGESVSGLEDEYLLSTGLPSLIYLKDPAPEREARLGALIDRIRDDDRSSYKTFASPDELRELLTTDLATLLADRFAAGATPTPSVRAEAIHGLDGMPGADLPAPYTPIVGRTAELDAIAALLAQPSVRILTLTGLGGIGKSRLAIDVALRAEAAGRDVAFTPLEAVSSPEGVITALARALGVRDAAVEGSLEDKIVASVGDRDILLVVDNLEHLLDATPLLVRLINRAPRLQLLVTSRAPLRVRAERIFEVGPLDVPDETLPAAKSSAVALFVQRAAAVRPGFRPTPADERAIVVICRALDGVPLAIELAAARMRSLSPRQILDRLDSALTLLVGGARDLPGRQRTLRATIEWSVDLLDADARAALATLSTFTGPFLLTSAESVLAALGIPDPLGEVETLLDAGLIARADRGGMPAYRLLSVVRAFAGEVGVPDGAPEARIAHYRGVAREAAQALRGPEQLEWLSALDLESENLGGVYRALLDRRELDVAAEYAWSLYLWLWIGGSLSLVRAWMADLLELAEHESLPLTNRTRAIALYYVAANRFWQEPGYDPAELLTESRDRFVAAGDEFGAALAGVSMSLGQLTRVGGPDFASAQRTLATSLDGFRAVGDAWGQAMALIMLARIDMLRGDLGAAGTRLEESLALATTQGERLGIVIALNHRGWVHLLDGNADAARTDFAEALDQSLALRHDEGIAYGLEAFVGLRAHEGDTRRAGLLLGAVQTLRRRKGLANPGAFEFFHLPLEGLRAAGEGEALEAAAAEGRCLTVSEALEHVRD